MRSAEMLTILHNSDTTFTDLSNYCHDFLRDSFILEPLDDDYIYIGYYKPINQIFVERVSGTANTGSMTGQYYNTTDAEWQSLTGFYDDTKNLNRSGFISWERNQLNQGNSEIDSTDLFWIRLKTGALSNAVTLIAINIVFADDNDLKAEFYNILDTDYLRTGQTSHIASHLAARREIIQEIRNSGKKKKFGTLLPTNTYSFDKIYGYAYENINAWDILDIGEIRTAATYLAMSKVFFSLSDRVDDFYNSEGNRYRKAYQDALSLFYLSIDESDDGLANSEEKLQTNTYYMTR